MCRALTFVIRLWFLEVIKKVIVAFGGRAILRVCQWCMGGQGIGGFEGRVHSDIVGHQTSPHREQPACWAPSFRSKNGCCVVVWAMCPFCMVTQWLLAKGSPRNQLSCQSKAPEECQTRGLTEERTWRQMPGLAVPLKYAHTKTLRR